MNDVNLGTIFAAVELRLDGLTTGVAQSTAQIKTLATGLDALGAHGKTSSAGLDALERRLRAVAQSASEAQSKLASVKMPDQRRVAAEQALNTIYQADHSVYDEERQTARRQYGEQRDAGVPNATAQEAYAAKIAAIDRREEADQVRHQAALQRQREADRRAEESVWEDEYKAGLISNARMAALLEQRLALYAKSTARFAELTRELRRVPQATITVGTPSDAPATPTGILPKPQETLGPSVDAELAPEDKKQQYLYQSQQESLAQYQAYLRQRLASLTQYSDAWYVVAERLRAVDLTEARDSKTGTGNNPFAKLSSAMESVVTASMRHWSNFRTFFQKLMAELAQMLLTALGESALSRILARPRMPRAQSTASVATPAVPALPAAVELPSTPPIAPRNDGAASALGALTTLVPGASFAQVLGVLGGSGNLFKSLLRLFHFERGGLPSVGVPSIVGERGPELFVPSIAGRIVPNGELTTPAARASASNAAPSASRAGARHYSVTVHQHIGTVQGVEDLQRAGDDLGWSLTHRLAVAK